MFKSILVPLDRSPLAECVLPHLVSMALPLGASVTLLTVCEPQAHNQMTQPVNALSWRLMTAEADSYLEGISARLAEAGLDVESHRLEGKPAEQVLAFAHQNGFDLIVVSSHGRSGLTGWNVSSVVQKIIARARVSVMIVRAYRPSTGQLTRLTYSRLLCPLDCSQRAEHALPPATMLARAHAAKLLLAHVLVKPEMPRRRPLAAEEVQAIDKVVELNRAEAERCLKEVRSSQAAEQVDVETRLLVSDNRAQSLHDLVKQEGIDLVIMSAHGCSGSTSWPYGSLALNFIAYGTTPLLITQDLAPGEMERSEAETMAQEPTGR
jgi:nucleotide-binding universal stress UspA family protein